MDPNGDSADIDPNGDSEDMDPNVNFFIGDWVVIFAIGLERE